MEQEEAPEAADRQGLGARIAGREAVDYPIEPAFAGTFTVLPENMSRAFMLSTLAS